MNKRKLLMGLLAVVLVLALTGQALAASLVNYDLSWQALTGGGGRRGSVTTSIQDALGQWAAGTSTGASIQVQGGFESGWYPTTPIFVPLIQR